MRQETSVFLLAAGRGSRLQPYTKDWPKCLMPIAGRPLLEYWLGTAKQICARNVVVNTHYLAHEVQAFLKRPVFSTWVNWTYEAELKGTAGALRENAQAFSNCTILLVHADNLCQCDFGAFLRFHQLSRPSHCLITMMTFYARDPTSCGIVELDASGVVIGFHEKLENPPGNLANGAVYLLEPEVLQWICERPEILDFSTEVLPHFIGRVATWHNEGVHIDIGSIEALREAQAILRAPDTATFESTDNWSMKFASHPIHDQIKRGTTSRVSDTLPTL